MKELTQLDRIEYALNLCPQAENNKLGVMYALLCSKCKDNTNMFLGQRAVYVYKGNSLCLKHMEEEINAKNV